MTRFRPKPWLLALFGLFGILALSPFEARAKSVTLEWETLSDAVQYELRVVTGGRTVVQRKLPSTKWKGDLPYGAYTYQLRSIDKAKRPGNWGRIKPLVVMGRPPEPLEPKDGSRFHFYDPRRRIRLKWGAVENISRYRVELMRGKRVVYDRTVAETAVDLQDLPAGNYTWGVKAVIEAEEDFPSVSGKHVFESESGSTNDFTLAVSRLTRPTLLFPLDPIPPTGDNRVRLEWSEVDGAERYEVKIIKVQNGSRNLVAEFEKARSFVVKDNFLVVRAADEATYSWQVRALAHIEDKPKPGAIGPESTAQFQIDPTAIFTVGTGYYAISTMLAPYTYRSVSSLAGSGGRTQSTAGTLRLSGEYWFAPHWGLSPAIERTSFTINSSDFNRMTFELMAKYRMSITHQKFGWFFAPKAGLEMRQYFLLALSGGNGQSSLQETDVAASGVSVGFDLRKQFSDRWSMGIKTQYFYPLLLSGAPSGYSLSPTASYRNASIGAQGLYWVAKGWGISAGAYVEARSISYAPPGSDSSASEQVWMDGMYFFGSVLYSFGGK